MCPLSDRTFAICVHLSALDIAGVLCYGLTVAYLPPVAWTTRGLKRGIPGHLGVPLTPAPIPRPGGLVKKVALFVLFGALAFSHNASANSASSLVHKGSTALTWLSNPAHKKFGTLKSRAKAINLYTRVFMEGITRYGFWPNANCVHRGEAPWHYHGYFDGGMQMDDEFQRDYGLLYLRRWGDAGYWPVWAQLHASFKGWLGRGWYPWPNTARACGLI